MNSLVTDSAAASGRRRSRLARVTVKLFNPTRTTGAVGFFVLLALIVHWLPNLGVPLQSDTSWTFLLQSSHDAHLSTSVPEGLRFLSAYPQDPISGAVSFSQVAQRYNVGNNLQYWFTAWIAGENADIWRLIPILFMGAAVGLFYRAARLLAVNAIVAGLVSMWLLFTPFDAWQEYNKSESLAVFFMMGAIFLAARAHGTWSTWASAGAMAAAVLTKETFFPAWSIVFAVQVRWIWSDRSSAGRWGRLVRSSWPHFAAAAIIVSAFIAIAATRESGPNYSSTTGDSPGLLAFIREYATNVTPILQKRFWAVPVLVLTAMATIGVLVGALRRRTVPLRPGVVVIAVVLGAAVIMHAVAYWLTGRTISGRYVIPANFEMGMLVAIAATWIWEWSKSLSRTRWVWLSLALAAALVVLAGGIIYAIAALIAVAAAGAYLFQKIFIQKDVTAWKLAALVFGFILVLAPLVDVVLRDAGQNRTDQTKWWSLIREVEAQAPENGHVDIVMDGVLTIETAQSLAAHLILHGRNDLAFSARLAHPESPGTNSPWAKLLFDKFNASLAEMPTDPSKVMTITLDRHGDRNYVRKRSGSSIPSRLISLFAQRYGTDRPAYLQYDITFG